MSKYRKECWTDADVRCPFYISDERSARSITIPTAGGII